MTASVLITKFARAWYESLAIFVIRGTLAIY